MAVVSGVTPRTSAEQKNVAANIKPAIASKLAHIKEVNDAYQADLMYANSRYRLCVSDVVSLKFPHAPEFNQTVSVEPGWLCERSPAP